MLFHRHKNNTCESRDFRRHTYSGVEWRREYSTRYFILIKYLREYSHLRFVHMGPYESWIWRGSLGLLHYGNLEKCSGLMKWHVMTCHLMPWNFERILKLVLTDARNNFSCKMITCHFGDVALDDVAYDDMAFCDTWHDDVSNVDTSHGASRSILAEYYIVQIH